MELHYLRQFKADNKEESIKKIKDELTFLRAKIKHTEREIEKLQEEIKESTEKATLLEQLLNVSHIEHFAIDFSIKEEEKGRLYVILTCEDGTRVAITQKIMEKLAKAWSVI
jgi:septal ring factor EnvC (AmiA/AmiB activator)